MARWSFTEHPASVGETYLEHFWQASKFAARMIAAGLSFLANGFFPRVLAGTGSRAIASLHDDMVTNRHRLKELRKSRR